MRYSTPTKDTLMAALTKERDALKKQVETQQQLRQYLKKFDGRVLNKTIADKVEQVNPDCSARVGRRWRDSATKNFDVEVRTGPGYEDKKSVIWFHDIDQITDDKGRLIYSKLEKRMLEDIQKNRKALAQIASDLIFGVEKLEKMEQAKQYYLQLAKGFSKYIGQNFDFDIHV